ncbi:hypothetical protein GEMRC1_011357 [Eukaryota sp. GEM-RC1]
MAVETLRFLKVATTTQWDRNTLLHHLNVFSSTYDACLDEPCPWDDSYNLNSLAELIADPRLVDDVDITLSILAALRIIARFDSCRQGFSTRSLEALYYLLKQSNAAFLYHLVSVVTNLCYTETCTVFFVTLNIVPFVNNLLISLNDDPTLSALCVLLQTLAFHESGKVKCVEEHSILVLSSFLTSTSSSNSLKEAALGAVHNLTTKDSVLKDCANLPFLNSILELLHSSNDDVQSSAAGTLQNLARDLTCREILKEIKGVEHLCFVLANGSTTGQKGALGALVNILSCDLDEKSFESVKGLLSSLIVMGFFGNILNSET